MSQPSQNTSLSPAAIGEYLSFDHCSRFFQHRVKEIEKTENHGGDEFTEAFNPLNVLLAKTGEEFETEILDDLTQHAAGMEDLGRDEETFIKDHSEVIERVDDALGKSAHNDPVILYQPTVAGEIESWDIHGHADFVLIWSTGPDTAELRVVDAKSAEEQQTYHQVQAAIYTHLIDAILEAAPDIDGDQVTLSAGVITRSNEYIPPTPETVPSFEYETRITDVTRLLSSGGEIETTNQQSLADAPHQLDSKCSGCVYNEACSTAAFEEQHVRLLGLTESEQQLLESHGITSLSELADLCREPNDWEWNPTEQKKASWEKSPYAELKATPGFGEKLPNLVYRAQALVKHLDPSNDTFPAAWIPGTGKCALPDDNPPADFDFKYERGSMIRVYLNVQSDHLRDKIVQLSARVNSTGSDEPARRISVLTDDAPTDQQQAHETEADLLNKFISELYDEIQQIDDSMAIELSEQQHPLLHFYTYTKTEFNSLIDAFNRHDSTLIQSFQDTLEGNVGVDKPRVSHLKPEIKQRVAIASPSYGLLHAYDELQPPQEEYSKSRSADSWSYDPPYSQQLSSVNLRSIFNRRLFNITVDWELTNGDLQVTPDGHDQIDGLKTRFRHGAEIPLGYQWAAIGRIDDQWIDDLPVDGGGGLIEYEIQSYRHHDATKQDQAITPTDVEELGRSLCDVLEHVERSLMYQDKSLAENKSPVDTSLLTRDTHDLPTIGEASKDYLWLEHTTRQREIYQEYRKLPSQRILSGSSLPVQIMEVDEDKGNSLSIWVKGKLRYDELFGERANAVKRVCKRKGDEETSSGDWMVANPFDPGRTDQAVSEPYELEAGINATIKRIDMKEAIVEFELRNIYWEPGEFDSYHRNYATDKGRGDKENYTYISGGEWLILDPLTDNISADRANKALDNLDTNALEDTLEALRWGDSNALGDPVFDAADLSEFTEWVSNEIPPSTYPNNNQQSFIESDSQITLLQGPPGTGKTAGTMAPALCARIHAAEQGGTTTAGLVTAPSNTAIDEMLEDTAELLAKVADSPLKTIKDENIELVRLTNNEPSNTKSNVEYLDYNNDGDEALLRQIKNHLTNTSESLPAESDQKQAQKEESGRESERGAGESQATFQQFAGGEPAGDSESEKKEEPERTHTLIFATPTKSWGLLKHFADDNEPDQIANQEYWNLLAADEASMLTTPKLLLTGTAMKRDAQLLISGDHRQLPPVQKHDWNEEHRRSVTETIPHLSALDYFRLLRGEADDVLDEDERDTFEGEIAPNTNPIPMVQLDETYRFGPDTAAFLNQTVYEQDGINYTSARSKQNITPRHTADTDPLTTAFEEGSVTLITYDTDATYQQVNLLEATISQALLRNHHPDASAGLVTPHNAQRSRLKEMLRALEKQPETNIKLGENTHVETVERFQGGEQDLMIVSATASDPQFIRSENEFLLQQNRANVSFSRHKNKLIVIAAESLLSHIPSDPDVYDEALLWKTLPLEVGEPPLSNTTPAWSGNLAEFVDPLTPPSGFDSQQIEINIFGL